MKRHILLAITLMVGLGSTAQEASNVTGVVVDKLGNPVSGAMVEIQNNPNTKAYTNRQGVFEISADVNDKLVIDAPDQSKKTVSLSGGKTVKVVMDYASQPVNIGFGITQTVGESTMSVASAANSDFNNRSAKNIGNSLFGNVLGLTTLQGSGDYSSYEPSFYVRGLQTLGSSTPLVLVDGVERNISYITPEEVENVIVLKDAAAVALYGYKGANGAINIVTKRGKYRSNEINFSYDHSFNWEERRPDFADAYTYASAMNEAFVNDGKDPKYSAVELDAFKSGKYPYYYPNVNWIKEAFKDNGSSNIYDLSFRGGGTHMRYYTLINLQDNRGFIAHPNTNDGFSTQNKYSKANLRSNLDIDVTSTTKAIINLDGVLLESLRPGLGSDGLWDKIYTVPAAAFPIKTESGLWGGNATWNGYSNPVALTEGRAYSKAHTRALFADLTLKQDLSVLTNGLTAWTRLAYDNISSYWENHTREYKYGSDAVSEWTNGEPSAFSHYTGGKDGSLSSDSKLDWQNKNLNFGIGVNYDRTFGNHSISSVLMWNYEYRNSNGQNNTWYRNSASLYNHYGYKGRYFADVSLNMAASNKLAPGHRWAFSPAVSAAWVMSREDFMSNISFVDFLKLRASWGIINVDNIPEEGYWEQTFTGGSGYNLGGNYDASAGWTEGRLASSNFTHERAAKYNVGLDASLFKGLNLTVDGYYQRRSDIWVSAGGKNSTVLGISNPYINGGIVDSWGVEAGADYVKSLNHDLQLTMGANYTLAKNKIKDECEEPRAYKYLERRKRVEAVREFRLASKSEGTRKIADKPTRFHVENMPNSSYIIIPRVSSERRRFIPIGFLSPDIFTSDSAHIIPNATLYHFGILTSNVHNAWMRVVCGRLKSDYRYSKDVVYNNFPWPSPTPEQKAAIEQSAQAILDARAMYPDSTLADLYDEVFMPVELRKAHQMNDKAVMSAYGFPIKDFSESDCVAALMKLYQKLVSK
jgi:TonB-linked SusC/RagA family outer membrane protein